MTMNAVDAGPSGETHSDPGEHYRVHAELGRYGDQWIVVRRRDGKVMTASESIFQCLRWVRVWGPMRVHGI